MSKIIEKVDVICEHKSDGSVIPMRLRFQNEDGEYETYNIKGYRQVVHPESQTTNDGIFVVAASTLHFECMILAVGMKRMIRLYYDPRTSGKWKLAI
ncbi:hypothetical protein [Butyrivibrio sp. AC2005]|uniref:hypothetical protein n=1 Tax=Butyrivibrio sp. AC2005 TaxID=1280672 RepID=UPI00040571F4|nr:hypothetical protein [Butyrivibrio sp. AC2005]